jgi:hypothetical protein
MCRTGKRKEEGGRKTDTGKHMRKKGRGAKMNNERKER